MRKEDNPESAEEGIQADLIRLESESNISRTSFKRWHRHLQTEHILSKRSSFTLCKCCEKTCRPCRWFDSISYEKKICKCCFTFRNFKNLGTILLIAIFVFLFSFSIFKEQVLPGGTVFFLFILFITAYTAGHIIMLFGLPPMLAHLAVGITFENLPVFLLPQKDEYIIDQAAQILEEILLVLALIRAGLYLDLSRIQRHVAFIFQLSLFPLIFEFITLWFTSFLLLDLPWDWSAVQGSVMCVVSMASITSIMHKNKHNGYGEDKDLSTVLIAASVLNVLFGLFIYVIALTYTLPQGALHKLDKPLLILLIETVLGLAVGGLSGLLVAFFPDKRNTEAPALRILMITVGSFAITNIFASYDMLAAAALGCVTLCIIATNMWEELGWHKDHNPVVYFFTMAYYFSQPVVLSLVGFTMDFRHSDKKEIGMSVSVLFCGLVVRETVTIITTYASKSYPTTIKEKIYILIAWFSKGTFQALLCGAVCSTLSRQTEYFREDVYEQYVEYAKTVKETTVVAILITTPLACVSLSFLSPVLLTKQEQPGESRPIAPERRRTSIKYIGKYSPTE